jgi:YD repeat-containing protein
VALGRRTSVTGPLGKMTRYAYDDYGRLVEVVDPAGGATAYAYDLMGHMLSRHRRQWSRDVVPLRRVRPRLSGRAFMVRYADDAVLVFSSEADARRVLAVLPERFSKYGLTLHLLVQRYPIPVLRVIHAR